MKENTINKLKVHVQNGSQFNLALDNGTIHAVANNNQFYNTYQKIKSRTSEYAKKWNQNMFLNNFDKRDENTGINIKLEEVYLESQLPQYKWKENSFLSNDLKELLLEYNNNNIDNKMLLILGQPGIGKSTLITWITANFVKNINNIFIYQFSSDLKNIEWKRLKLKGNATISSI